MKIKILPTSAYCSLLTPTASDNVINKFFYSDYKDDDFIEPVYNKDNWYLEKRISPSGTVEWFSWLEFRGKALKVSSSMFLDRLRELETPVVNQECYRELKHALNVFRKNNIAHLLDLPGIHAILDLHRLEDAFRHGRKGYLKRKLLLRQQGFP
jgi:hypothetical protein